MAKLLFGSIDFSKLLEEAKKGNKAFSRASNGKIYLNVNVWINDEKDTYGNDASMQSSFKDATKEDRFYFGNLKESIAKEPEAIAENSADIPASDDLPF
jgi:hypothetical protein